MDRSCVSAMAGEHQIMAVKHVPWWAKLAAKLVLARLPIPYAFWRKLGLFRHGKMNEPQRAIDTYVGYQQRAERFVSFPENFQTLELGPGDSALSGLVSRSMGASKAWLVDAGAFADTDLEACNSVFDRLREQGKSVPEIVNAHTLSEVLDQSNVTYLTEGTASLSQIPDATIDFQWSQVVLEHVLLDEFRDLVAELRRIMAPGGIGIHSIDFRDHLDGGLNNLRFSADMWESPLFQNSGFYTNRLRPKEMIGIFEECGFTVEIIHEDFWPDLPLAHAKMARQFTDFGEADFRVSEIEIAVRPK